MLQFLQSGEALPYIGALFIALGVIVIAVTLVRATNKTAVENTDRIVQAILMRDQKSDES